VPELSRTDVAWLAGWLEGEGNFSRGVVRVTSTDFDVLEKALRMTGIGNICAPSADPRGNRKPSWVWTVSRKADARQLMELVWPHMGLRRKGQISHWIGQTLTVEEILRTRDLPE
jgi:hypothetical protein